MWRLGVKSSFAGSLARENTTEHFSIVIETDNSEHETYYLRSDHVDVLPVSESKRAFYRLKVLLRILNASLSLNGTRFEERPISYPIIAAEGLFYSDVGNTWSRVGVNYDWDIELQELTNPYDTSVLQQTVSVSTGNRRNALINLTVTDELVRENLLMFSLTNDDPLYVFINSYRILDTVLYEYSVNLQGADPVQLVKLKTAIDTFEKRSFNHYMNTRDGSGLLSRHGVKNGQVYNKPKPTVDDVLQATYELLNVWLDIKL